MNDAFDQIDNINSELDSIKNELNKSVIDPERFKYLLDRREQLNGKLSELYMMETLKHERY